METNLHALFRDRSKRLTIQACETGQYIRADHENYA